jgi:photosystem II stability/assembly factor-like uncharacterized protein
VRRLYVIIAGIFILAGLYCISGEGAASHKSAYFGDADALGADDDAEARITYELMQLRDPATGQIPGHMRERELAFATGLPTDISFAFSRTSGTSALSWTPRGPWNVGGRTRAMALDVSNENNIIAGSCSGGMWRSTDQGATWTPTTPSTQYKSVSCLSQDTRPGHTNVWYYGTGEAFGASASATGAYYLGNGIYKSVDSGVTWTNLASTAGASLTAFGSWGQLIWNVVTNPADLVNDAVYAAAYGGIYKSTDGGTSWTRVLGTYGSASDAYFTDVAVSPSGIIYATISSESSARGIYRSTDGVTFANITPDSFPATYNRIKIGVSPSNEEQVYFLGNTPGYGQPDTNYLGTVEWNSLWRYTYISGDGTDTGGAWQNRSSSLPSSGGMFDKFTSQGSYDLVVKVKPNDTNTVFIGGTNLYRSTSAFADTGHTTFIGGYQQGGSLPVINDYLNHHPDQHELVFSRANPDRMLSSNDGGIFMTTDNTASAVVWKSLNNGYLNTMFYSCAIDHATSSNIIIGGAQDNGSWFINSTNLTDPWVTPRGGDGSFCAIADSSKAYYFSIQSGKMMRAKLDAAGTVDSFARIDPIGGTGYLFSNPYTIDPNNNDLMYLAAGHCLWRNNNLSGIPYASNWDSISTNWVKFPDSLTVSSAAITAVAVSKMPANRVYYGTSIGKIYRIDDANTGTPTATNISPALYGTLFPYANINCIAVDPTNADNVIVVFSNYNVYSLFYSTNGGTSWSKGAGNLEQRANGTGDGPSLRWASIMPVADGYVYLVGTSVGLFATTQLHDTSTVWTQQGTNTIGADVVDMMDFRATDGLVVVATHSSGIFSTHIAQVADVNSVKTVVAAGNSLNFTNFPNPFSQATNIQFDLKDNSNVSLCVYDGMGRLVRTLMNGPAVAGKQAFTFAADGLSAGIYYCVLQTGTTSETRLLSLIN